MMRHNLKVLTEKYEQIIGKHSNTENKVDPEQLALGIKTELEHTSDKKVAQEIALDHLAEDPAYYTKLTKAGLEEASFAQDLGSIIGSTARGMAQRAADIQDTGGKTTAKIMGTHYPRKADYPTSHPRDFERTAQARQKELRGKNLDVDTISSDLSRAVVNKATSTLGSIDLDNLDKTTAVYLTDLVDKEAKNLKKTGMDGDNIQRVQREVIRKLGLSLYK